MKKEELIEKLKDKTTNDEDLKNLISQNLFELNEEDRNEFLNVLFHTSKHDVKKFTVSLIAQNPDKALNIFLYLMNAEDDDMAELKYYGARIVHECGHKLDFKITFPLLVESYSFDHYRDTNWAISMALATLCSAPIRLINESAKNITEEHRAGLFSQIYSYSLIDVEDFKER